MREVEGLRDENGRLRIARRGYDLEPQSPFPLLSGAEIVSILHSGGDRLNDTERHAEAALRNAIERVKGARQGERNRLFNNEALGVARFVASGVLDGQRVADALAAAAITAGISPQVVLATLSGAFSARRAA